MGDTWDKVGLELLLRLENIGCRDRYETRLNFYKPLCYSKIFNSRWSPTLLRLFLLFKGVKSLYFTYSIMNFTALNLQGITSLHLLTTRVELLSLLKLVRLFLQITRVA